MPHPTSIGRGAAWALLLAGLTIARILAQAPTQPNGSLSGRVLDGVTGQAIVGAEVMLDPTGSVRSRGGSTRTGRIVTTNAQGAFTFGDVAPGSHRIEGSKTGYKTGYAGGVTATAFAMEPLQLSGNERRTGIVVRMWQSAAIGGKVKLASGGPVVRTTVIAMRAISTCGSDRLLSSATTTTDDTGAYRFFDLSPVDYVIGTTTVLGSTMASGLHHTTYYPGVVDPAAARAVSLRGGDEQIDVDIVLPNSNFAVNGRVVMTDGSATSGKWAVDLRSGSTSPVVDRPVARTFTGSDGRFQFQHVPAGRYVTRVVEFPPVPSGGIRQMTDGFSMSSSDRGKPLPPMTDAATWWGEARVEVTDRDADATVRLQEGWRIQGQVKFDAATGAPPPGSLESMPVLTFRSDGSDLGGFAVGFQSGRVETDGRFTTVGLPPGRYLLSVMLALPSPTPAATNLRLQAVRLGGRDVTGSAIDVDGANVNDVTVVFTDRGPTIAGTVEGGSDLETFGSRVYIFPTEERYWSDCGSGWPRLLSVSVGSEGRFQASVPPGQYFVAATIGAEDNWIKTEFLRSLVPFVTRVKLELGDKPLIQVKARPRK